MKESKITRKDPFEYENGAYNNKLDALFLVFNEHDKDIKYTQNIFHVLVQSMKKRKLSSYRGFLFVSLVPQVRKRDKPMPKNTLLNSKEKRRILSCTIPHGLRK